jgi:GT2 family glycosyltransferase
MRASVPISVVIPTWRGAAWLPRCLEALSQQTCRPCEVVLVQNGGPAPEISPRRSFRYASIKTHRSYAVGRVFLSVPS